MKIVFRVDASVTIGSGHVMRCLALADALRRCGASCEFVCRELAGNLIETINARGHTSHALSPSAPAPDEFGLDAEQTRRALETAEVDWLVVDHYQLGRDWEQAMRSFTKRLLAIDDIGRAHACDVLLDQNYPNPTHARYVESGTGRAELLLGPCFALLAHQFSDLRERALSRRDGSLQRLLVTMGGSDGEDETSKVLSGIRRSALAGLALDVVVGAANQNRHRVAAECARLPLARLHVQTSRMAELMTAADCAVSASGSTTWERCCLGLPALVTALSPDQLPIAESLDKKGAHTFLGLSTSLRPEDYAGAIAALSADRLRAMSATAAAVCDGQGASRVASRLLQ